MYIPHQAGTVWEMLKRTYERWDRHEAPRLGAALAFYSLLSLAPLVIVSVGMVGLFFGEASAQRQILDQVREMVGPEGERAVSNLLAETREPTSGMLSNLLGLATLLFGASAVFGELRSSLNKAWEVKTDDQNGIMSVVKKRFLSFGMVLAVGFLLLVSLVASAAISVVGKFFSGFLPFPEVALQWMNIGFSFVAITVLFALIYQFVPETDIKTKDVIVGALATSLLFTIGKTLIGLYLGKATPGSPYGAAGSLVVIIIWVYYSAQIFFFGAEFTQVYAHARGSKVGEPEGPKEPVKKR